jgi:hypothetical protein
MPSDFPWCTSTAPFVRFARTASSPPGETPHRPGPGEPAIGRQSQPGVPSSEDGGLGLRLQPTRVRLGPDENGCLVFMDGALAAVLVQLSALHEEDAGCWSVEALFGIRVHHSQIPLFATPQEAAEWLAGARLSG